MPTIRQVCLVAGRSPVRIIHVRPQRSSKGYKDEAGKKLIAKLEGKEIDNVKKPFILTLLLFVMCSIVEAQAVPTEGDFIARDFKFESGESLPELRIHYCTIGTPRKDTAGVVRNAVLILHGTGGWGNRFLRPQFGGVLFGAGQLLDASKYFIIIPDGIGHGKSSKPSDGLRMKFPHYNYNDMVLAQYRLLIEHLGVNHLRLVMGTSMGGMHTWVWGERYPDFMDALMPLASLPVQIAGRNRMWRRMVINSIKSDPDWQNGEYKTQPLRGLTGEYCGDEQDRTAVY